MTVFIGIAGGSGSGKSTLAYGLKDKYPDRIEVLHFDDYQKKGRELEKIDGMPNRDSPGAVKFEELIRDLEILKSGKSIEILTSSERFNPDFRKTGEKVPYTLNPKEIILVEGYLALQNEKVRKFLNYSIFLDASDDTRVGRRNWKVSQEYIDKVLIPMHNQHIEPTKKYATLLVDVEKINSKDLQELVTRELYLAQIL